MLKDFPVRFDETEIIQWSKWEEEREVIENTYETEAGTDQVDVVRYGKLTVSCEYRCHSEWLRIFTDFSEHDSIQVTLYDAKLLTSTTKTMRIRDFKTKPIEFSENVQDTNGVWNVSFKLEEF